MTHIDQRQIRRSDRAEQPVRTSSNDRVYLVSLEDYHYEQSSRDRGDHQIDGTTLHWVHVSLETAKPVEKIVEAEFGEDHDLDG